MWGLRFSLALKHLFRFLVFFFAWSVWECCTSFLLKPLEWRSTVLRGCSACSWFVWIKFLQRLSNVCYIPFKGLKNVSFTLRGTKAFHHSHVHLVNFPNCFWISEGTLLTSVSLINIIAVFFNAIFTAPPDLIHYEAHIRYAFNWQHLTYSPMYYLPAQVPSNIAWFEAFCLSLLLLFMSYMKIFCNQPSTTIYDPTSSQISPSFI